MDVDIEIFADDAELECSEDTIVTLIKMLHDKKYLTIKKAICMILKLIKTNPFIYSVGDINTSEYL